MTSKIKKQMIFCFALALLITFLSSCDATTITTTKENLTSASATNESTTPESDDPIDGLVNEPVSEFSDYDSILNMYFKIIDLVYNCDDLNDLFDGMFDKNFKLSNENEQNWYQKLIDAVYFNQYYLTKGHKPVFGYAQKDSNNNGDDELILLLDNYTVVAVFSMYSGKPMLLDSSGSRYRCTIDSMGKIYTSGSSGAMDNVYCTYEISQDGKELILLGEFGVETWNHETLEAYTEPNYYKMVDGKKQNISKSEASSIAENFRDNYFDDTTKNSGLEFNPLTDKKEVYILTATADCYVRTSTEISNDSNIRNSDGSRVVLRKGQTVRLLQWQIVFGGEYPSGSYKRSDWYKIEYDGKICYVTADSFKRSCSWVSEEEYLPMITEKIFLPQNYHLGTWYTDRYKLDELNLTELTSGTLKFHLWSYRVVNLYLTAEITADGIVFEDKESGITGRFEFTEETVTVYIDKCEHLNIAGNAYIFQLRPRKVLVKVGNGNINVYSGTITSSDIKGRLSDNTEVFLLQEKSFDDKWYHVGGISTSGKYISGMVEAEYLFDSEKVPVSDPQGLRETLIELALGGYT